MVTSSTDEQSQTNSLATSRQTVTGHVTASQSNESSTTSSNKRRNKRKRRTSSEGGGGSLLRAARTGNLEKLVSLLDNEDVDITTCNSTGLTALHLAAKEGHYDIIEALFERGASANQATKMGNTGLHIACLAGKLDIVKLLLKKKAEPNALAQNSFTPLYMAAQEGHEDIVEYLLEHGANHSLPTEDGFTPLAVALQEGRDRVVALLLEKDDKGRVKLPPLHIAAKRDDAQAAALLLQNDNAADTTAKMAVNRTSESGFTALHIAAHYGNVNVAEVLLNRGAMVDFKAKNGITAMHVAAKRGHTRFCGLLLEHRGRPELCTRDGLMPLHCAARSGHFPIVKLFLDNDNTPKNAKTKNGLSVLHMAAQGGHAEVVELLLARGFAVDDVTSDYLSALHIASHCGHLDVVKLLLQHGAYVDFKALNGFTPLHVCCKKNREEVVEMLLFYKANKEALTESGLTPLHIACFMGHRCIVEILVEKKADLNTVNVRGETALHMATRAGQTDIVTYLLRHGAKPDARKQFVTDMATSLCAACQAALCWQRGLGALAEKESQTCLHLAARLDKLDILKLLIKNRAYVNETMADGYTPLHVGAREGHVDVCEVLLDHKASVAMETKKGFTPLHLASKYGRLEVANLLLKRSSSPDACGKDGLTPLHVAAHYDNQQVALLLLKNGASPHASGKNGYTSLHIAARMNQMEIALTLLEYGASPNCKTRMDVTPLHLAAQEGHTDMCSVLIAKDADVNAPARHGLTPMHLAAQEDRVSVAKVLYDNEALVDPLTKSGCTPLHIASHHGNINVANYLLSLGAKVNAKTKNGYTPLHQASQQGHTHIVNLLLKYGASPNELTNSGNTALSLAKRLGYVTVVDTLQTVTTEVTTTVSEEKRKFNIPETVNEGFMSEASDDEGDDNTSGGRYLTKDEMRELGDDSIAPTEASMRAVGRDSRYSALDHAATNGRTRSWSSSTDDDDTVKSRRSPRHSGFLVSFMVDARGGCMRGSRNPDVRVLVPPKSCQAPTRVTCRMVRRRPVVSRLPQPHPPLFDGEGKGARVLEVGPRGGSFLDHLHTPRNNPPMTEEVGLAAGILQLDSKPSKFMGPVALEVPYYVNVAGNNRQVAVMRSSDGETWKPHEAPCSDAEFRKLFKHEDLEPADELASRNVSRIVTKDFPRYFALVSRPVQDSLLIGPKGGELHSSVLLNARAKFPEGALTKNINVSMQVLPISAEVCRRAVGGKAKASAVLTIEPRRRKFHKSITLSIPLPEGADMREYLSSTDDSTLRLLCSISGGSDPAQWEDITGSTSLNFLDNCVTFTSNVSARFWLIDCRQPSESCLLANKIYHEATRVPYKARFVVFAKSHDPLEAKVRVLCLTDHRDQRTLESQQKMADVARSKDVEVLDGSELVAECSGNLSAPLKSGQQHKCFFRAFDDNKIEFVAKVRDSAQEPCGRLTFYRLPMGPPKTHGPKKTLCTLNIKLPHCDRDSDTEGAEPRGEVPSDKPTSLAEEVAEAKRRYYLIDPSSVEVSEEVESSPEEIARDMVEVIEKLNQVKEILQPGDVGEVRKPEDVASSVSDEVRKEDMGVEETAEVVMEMRDRLVEVKEILESDEDLHSSPPISDLHLDRKNENVLGGGDQQGEEAMKSPSSSRGGAIVAEGMSEKKMEECSYIFERYVEVQLPSHPAEELSELHGSVTHHPGDVGEITDDFENLSREIENELQRQNSKDILSIEFEEKMESLPSSSQDRTSLQSNLPHVESTAKLLTSPTSQNTSQVIIKSQDTLVDVLASDLERAFSPPRPHEARDLVKEVYTETVVQRREDNVEEESNKEDAIPTGIDEDIANLLAANLLDHEKDVVSDSTPAGVSEVHEERIVATKHTRRHSGDSSPGNNIRPQPDPATSEEGRVVTSARPVSQARSVRFFESVTVIDDSSTSPLHSLHKNITLQSSIENVSSDVSSDVESDSDTGSVSFSPPFSDSESSSTLEDEEADARPISLQQRIAAYQAATKELHKEVEIFKKITSPQGACESNATASSVESPRTAGSPKRSFSSSLVFDESKASKEPAGPKETEDTSPVVVEERHSVHELMMAWEKAQSPSGSPVKSPARHKRTASFQHSEAAVVSQSNVAALSNASFPLHTMSLSEQTTITSSVEMISIQENFPVDESTHLGDPNSAPSSTEGHDVVTNRKHECVGVLVNETPSEVDGAQRQVGKEGELSSSASKQSSAANNKDEDVHPECRDEGPAGLEEEKGVGETASELMEFEALERRLYDEDTVNSKEDEETELRASSVVSPKEETEDRSVSSSIEAINETKTLASHEDVEQCNSAHREHSAVIEAVPERAKEQAINQPLSDRKSLYLVPEVVIMTCSQEELDRMERRKESDEFDEVIAASAEGGFNEAESEPDVPDATDGASAKASSEMSEPAVNTLDEEMIVQERNDEDKKDPFSSQPSEDNSVSSRFDAASDVCDNSDDNRPRVLSDISERSEMSTTCDSCAQSREVSPQSESSALDDCRSSSKDEQFDSAKIFDGSSSVWGEEISLKSQDKETPHCTDTADKTSSPLKVTLEEDGFAPLFSPHHSAKDDESFLKERHENVCTEAGMYVTVEDLSSLRRMSDASDISGESLETNQELGRRDSVDRYKEAFSFDIQPPLYEESELQLPLYEEVEQQRIGPETSQQQTRTLEVAFDDDEIFTEDDGKISQFTASTTCAEITKAEHYSTVFAEVEQQCPLPEQKERHSTELEEIEQKYEELEMHSATHAKETQASGTFNEHEQASVLHQSTDQKYYPIEEAEQQSEQHVELEQSSFIPEDEQQSEEHMKTEQSPLIENDEQRVSLEQLSLIEEDEQWASMRKSVEKLSFVGEENDKQSAENLVQQAQNSLTIKNVDHQPEVGEKAGQQSPRLTNIEQHFYGREQIESHSPEHFEEEQTSHVGDVVGQQSASLIEVLQTTSVVEERKQFDGELILPVVEEGEQHFSVPDSVTQLSCMRKEIERQTVEHIERTITSPMIGEDEQPSAVAPIPYTAEERERQCLFLNKDGPQPEARSEASQESLEVEALELQLEHIKVTQRSPMVEDNEEQFRQYIEAPQTSSVLTAQISAVFGEDDQQLTEQMKETQRFPVIEKVEEHSSLLTYTKQHSYVAEEIEIQSVKHIADAQVSHVDGGDDHELVERGLTAQRATVLKEVEQDSARLKEVELKSYVIENHEQPSLERIQASQISPVFEEADQLSSIPTDGERRSYVAGEVEQHPAELVQAEQESSPIVEDGKQLCTEYVGTAGRPPVVEGVVLQSHMIEEDDEQFAEHIKTTEEAALQSIVFEDNELQSMQEEEVKSHSTENITKTSSAFKDSDQHFAVLKDVEQLYDVVEQSKEQSADDVKTAKISAVLEEVQQSSTAHSKVIQTSAMGKEGALQSAVPEDAKRQSAMLKVEEQHSYVFDGDEEHTTEGIEAAQDDRELENDQQSSLLNDIKQRSYIFKEDEAHSEQHLAPTQESRVIGKSETHPSERIEAIQIRNVREEQSHVVDENEQQFEVHVKATQWHPVVEELEQVSDPEDEAEQTYMSKNEQQLLKQGEQESSVLEEFGQQATDHASAGNASTVLVEDAKNYALLDQAEQPCSLVEDFGQQCEEPDDANHESVLLMGDDQETSGLESTDYPLQKLEMLSPKFPNVEESNLKSEARKDTAVMHSQSLELERDSLLEEVNHQSPLSEKFNEQALAHHESTQRPSDEQLPPAFEEFKPRSPVHDEYTQISSAIPGEGQQYLPFEELKQKSTELAAISKDSSEHDCDAHISEVTERWEQQSPHFKEDQQRSVVLPPAEENVLKHDNEAQRCLMREDNEEKSLTLAQSQLSAEVGEPEEKSMRHNESVQQPALLESFGEQDFLFAKAQNQSEILEKSQHRGTYQEMAKPFALHEVSDISVEKHSNAAQEVTMLEVDEQHFSMSGVEQQSSRLEEFQRLSDKSSRRAAECQPTPVYDEKHPEEPKNSVQQFSSHDNSDEMSLKLEKVDEQSTKLNKTSAKFKRENWDEQQSSNIGNSQYSIEQQIIIEQVMTEPPESQRTLIAKLPARAAELEEEVEVPQGMEKDFAQVENAKLGNLKSEDTEVGLAALNKIKQHEATEENEQSAVLKTSEQLYSEFTEYERSSDEVEEPGKISLGNTEPEPPAPVLRQVAKLSTVLSAVEQSSTVMKETEQPSTVIKEVEQTNTILQDIEQPLTVFTEIEQPSTVFTEIEQPSALLTEFEQQSTVLTEFEQPSTVLTEVQQSSAVWNEVEQSSKVLTEIEPPSTIFTELEQPLAVLKEVERPSKVLTEIDQLSTMLTEVEQPSALLKEVEQLSTMMTEFEQPSTVWTEFEQPSTVWTEFEQPSTVLTEVQQSSAVLNEVEQSSKVLTEIEQPYAVLTEVEQPSAVLKEVEHLSKVLTEIEQPFTMLTDVEQPSAVIAEFEQPCTVLTETEQTSTVLTEVEQPSTVLTKVEQPSAVLKEVEQSSKVLTEIEQPSTVLTKVEQPSAWLKEVEQPSTMMTEFEQPSTVLTEFEQPSTVLTEFEQPSTVLTKVQQPSAVLNEVEQSSKVLTEIEQPSTILTEVEQPSAVLKEVEQPSIVLTEIEHPSTMLTEFEQPSTVLTEFEQPSTVLTEVQQPSAVLNEVEQSSKVLTEIEQPSTILTEVEQPSAVLKEVEQPSKVLTEIEQPSTMLTEVEQPSAVLKEVQQPSIMMTDFEQPSTVLTEVQQPSAVLNEVEQSSKVLTEIEQPSTMLTKVEQPCAVLKEVEKPSKVLTKIEHPSTMLTEVEQPSALLTKTEQQSSVLTETEQPSTVLIKVQQSSAVWNEVEQSSKLLTEIEQPSTILTEVEQPSAVLKEVERPPKLLSELEQTSPVFIEFEQQSAVINEVEQTTTILKDVEQPLTVFTEIEQPYAVKTEVEQPSPVFTEVEQPSAVLKKVEHPSKMSTEIKQPSTMLTEVEQPSAVITGFEQSSAVLKEVEQPSKGLSGVEQTSPVFIEFEQPTTMLKEVEQPSAVMTEVEKSSKVLAEVEQPSTVWTGDEQSSTVMDEFEQTTTMLKDMEQPPTVFTEVEQPFTVLKKVKHTPTVLTEFEKPCTMLNEVEEPSEEIEDLGQVSAMLQMKQPLPVFTDVEQTSPVLLEVVESSTMLKEVGEASAVFTEVADTLAVSTKVKQPSSVFRDVKKSSEVITNVEQPSSVLRNMNTTLKDQLTDLHKEDRSSVELDSADGALADLERGDRESTVLEKTQQNKERKIAAELKEVEKESSASEDTEVDKTEDVVAHFQVLAKRFEECRTVEQQPTLFKNVQLDAIRLEEDKKHLPTAEEQDANFSFHEITGEKHSLAAQYDQEITEQDTDRLLGIAFATSDEQSENAHPTLRSETNNRFACIGLKEQPLTDAVDDVVSDGIARLERTRMSFDSVCFDTDKHCLDYSCSSSSSSSMLEQSFASEYQAMLGSSETCQKRQQLNSHAAVIANRLSSPEDHLNAYSDEVVLEVMSVALQAEMGEQIEEKLSSDDAEQQTEEPRHDDVVADAERCIDVDKHHADAQSASNEAVCAVPPFLSSEGHHFSLQFEDGESLDDDGQHADLEHVLNTNEDFVEDVGNVSTGKRGGEGARRQRYPVEQQATWCKIGEEVAADSLFAYDEQVSRDYFSDDHHSEDEKLRFDVQENVPDDGPHLQSENQFDCGDHVTAEDESFLSANGKWFSCVDKGDGLIDRSDRPVPIHDDAHYKDNKESLANWEAEDDDTSGRQSSYPDGRSLGTGNDFTIAHRLSDNGDKGVFDGEDLSSSVVVEAPFHLQTESGIPCDFHKDSDCDDKDSQSTLVASSNDGNAMYIGNSDDEDEKSESTEEDDPLALHSHEDLRFDESVNASLAKELADAMKQATPLHGAFDLDDALQKHQSLSQPDAEDASEYCTQSEIIEDNDKRLSPDGLENAPESASNAEDPQVTEYSEKREGLTYSSSVDVISVDSAGGDGRARRRESVNNERSNTMDLGRTVHEIKPKLTNEFVWNEAIVSPSRMKEAQWESVAEELPLSSIRETVAESSIGKLIQDSVTEEMPLSYDREQRRRIVNEDSADVSPNRKADDLRQKGDTFPEIESETSSDALDEKGEQRASSDFIPHFATNESVGYEALKCSLMNSDDISDSTTKGKTLKTSYNLVSPNANATVSDSDSETSSTISSSSASTEEIVLQDTTANLLTSGSIAISESTELLISSFQQCEDYGEVEVSSDSNRAPDQSYSTLLVGGPEMSNTDNGRSSPLRVQSSTVFTDGTDAVSFHATALLSNNDNLSDTIEALHPQDGLKTQEIVSMNTDDGSDRNLDSMENSLVLDHHSQEEFLSPPAPLLPIIKGPVGFGTNLTDTQRSDYDDELSLEGGNTQDSSSHDAPDFETLQQSTFLATAQRETSSREDAVPMSYSGMTCTDSAVEHMPHQDEYIGASNPTEAAQAESVNRVDTSTARMISVESLPTPLTADSVGDVSAGDEFSFRQFPPRENVPLSVDSSGTVFQFSPSEVFTSDDFCSPTRLSSVSPMEHSASPRRGDDSSASFFSTPSHSGALSQVKTKEPSYASHSFSSTTSSISISLSSTDKTNLYEISSLRKLKETIPMEGDVNRKSKTSLSEEDTDPTSTSADTVISQDQTGSFSEKLSKFVETIESSRKHIVVSEEIIPSAPPQESSMDFMDATAARAQAARYEDLSYMSIAYKAATKKGYYGKIGSDLDRTSSEQSNRQHQFEDSDAMATDASLRCGFLETISASEQRLSSETTEKQLCDADIDTTHHDKKSPAVKSQPSRIPVAKLDAIKKDLTLSNKKSRKLRSGDLGMSKSLPTRSRKMKLNKESLREHESRIRSASGMFRASSASKLPIRRKSAPAPTKKKRKAWRAEDYLSSAASSSTISRSSSGSNLSAKLIKSKVTSPVQESIFRGEVFLNKTPMRSEKYIALRDGVYTYKTSPALEKEEWERCQTEVRSGSPFSGSSDGNGRSTSAQQNRSSVIMKNGNKLSSENPFLEKSPGFDGGSHDASGAQKLDAGAEIDAGRGVGGENFRAEYVANRNFSSAIPIPVASRHSSANTRAKAGDIPPDSLDHQPDSLNIESNLEDFSLSSDSLNCDSIIREVEAEADADSITPDSFESPTSPIHVMPEDSLECTIAHHPLSHSKQMDADSLPNIPATVDNEEEPIPLQDSLDDNNGVPTGDALRPSACMAPEQESSQIVSSQTTNSRIQSNTTWSHVSYYSSSVEVSSSHKAVMPASRHIVQRSSGATAGNSDPHLDQKRAQVAASLGLQWPQLAGALGLSSDDVWKIQKQSDGGTPGAQSAAMLRLWAEGQNATDDKLASGLQEIGRNDLAALLEDNVFPDNNGDESQVDGSIHYDVSGFNALSAELGSPFPTPGPHISSPYPFTPRGPVPSTSTPAAKAQDEPVSEQDASMMVPPRAEAADDEDDPTKPHFIYGNYEDDDVHEDKAEEKSNDRSSSSRSDDSSTPSRRSSVASSSTTSGEHEVNATKEVEDVENSFPQDGTKHTIEKDPMENQQIVTSQVVTKDIKVDKQSNNDVTTTTITRTIVVETQEVDNVALPDPKLEISDDGRHVIEISRQVKQTVVTNDDATSNSDSD